MCAVQCSLVHYISVHCSLILFSIVQFRVATAVQCNSVHFNLVWWNGFVSVLLSAQVESFSASRMRGFLLEISFMKQHSWKKYGDLFYLFYLHIFHMISEIDAVYCTTTYYTVVHCTTLWYTVLHLTTLWYTVHTDPWLKKQYNTRTTHFTEIVYIKQRK